MNKGLRISFFSVVLLIATMGLLFSAGQKDTSDAEKGKDSVVLRYSSLRTEDIAMENTKNAEFTKKFPNIRIEFEAIKNTEYDTVLKTALATGVGADIVMLRSYDGGRQVYDSGNLMKLNDILPEIKNNFTDNSIATWSTEEGDIYGVPYFGSVTGVWYNKEIFKTYGLSVPQTWDEFLNTCNVLQKAGVTPLAHGTKDQWVLTETLLCDLGANFYGGEATRIDLIDKKIRYTDPRFVKAYDKMKELVKYFPKGYQGIDYVTMQQMFLNEQAAMFIAGSWELGIIQDAGLDAGWFAPPVEKKGDPIQYAFYADLALGINKDTKHPEEAIEFLRWIATPEHAMLLANELPGMFPPLKIDFKIEDPLSQSIIVSTQQENVVLTGQLMWESLSREEPSGETLQNEVMQKFLNGSMTAKEAVAYVQKGLDTWYY